MFIDYYAVLEVDEDVTAEEIKNAFYKQAKKWHPDKNPDIDTTERMKEITQAYLILKDAEARGRYNIEYQRFKSFKKEKQRQEEEYQRQEKRYQQPEYKQPEQAYSYTEYQSDDDILNKWMNNAKKQAVGVSKQIIEDLKGMVSVGAKAAAKEFGNQFIIQIVIAPVILLIIVALAKSCNS